MAKHVTLKRLPVKEEMTAYRVVGTIELDPRALAPFFRSEREMGAVEETKREEAYPELLDGLCADARFEQAQQRLTSMRKAANRAGKAEPQRGSHIAKVVLRPGDGFDYEDRKRDGKLTIWGPGDKLAESVCRIYKDGKAGEEDR